MRMRRMAAALLYLAIFAGEVLWNGFVPLVPQLSQNYDLSKFQAGVLLATSSAAIVVVSLPAASVCERYGPRLLTVVAAVLTAVSSIWQGLAGSYVEMIGARALFGIGFGILWITAVRWLSEIAGARESQALSLTVTTAGVSAVVGPAIAGVAVSQFGMAPPFIAIGILNLILAMLMWWEPTGTGMATAHEEPLREMLAGAAADHTIMVSLLVMATAGVFSAAINILVPLQLHANGVSTTVIGAGFGISAAVFIAFSAMVARAADRMVNVRYVAWGMAGAILVTVIPLVSESTPALFGYLLARSPLTAFMFTVAFPLGALGARRAGITVGAVAALINIAWSISMLMGPLVFAGVAQVAGNRVAYLVLMAVIGCSIAWIVMPRREAVAKVSRA
jgi:predicted MFS family arabinose efflux permease